MSGRVLSPIPDWRAWSITMDDYCTSECASVNVSPNQAIEIHAKVLAHRLVTEHPCLRRKRRIIAPRQAIMKVTPCGYRSLLLLK